LFGIKVRKFFGLWIEAKERIYCDLS